MHRTEPETTTTDRPGRRLSARTAGLLLAAAATGSLGFAAAASAAGPIDTSASTRTTGQIETSVVAQNVTTPDGAGSIDTPMIDTPVLEPTDPIWLDGPDDCPGCGMG